VSDRRFVDLVAERGVKERPEHRVPCHAVSIQAVRGATSIEQDEASHLQDRVAELLRTVLARNELTNADLISILFTATPDVHSDFPAHAARLIGLTDVPLMCSQELDVDGAPPLIIRLMAHIATERPREQISHVYLHRATVLRKDLDHPGAPQ